MGILLQLFPKNVAGTISEIEYSPIGKVAVMSGRTQLQAYVPLPGGEILSPGPDTFWHTDWLGSVHLASSASHRTITFDRAFAGWPAQSGFACVKLPLLGTGYSVLFPSALWRTRR